MTTTGAARLPLGVSLHTLDGQQRLETMQLLAGSSVKCLELWEPTFSKGSGFIQDARQTLAAAGVGPRTVHTAFGAALDISSPDPAVRSAGIQAAAAALDLAVQMGALIIVVHPSAEPIGNDEREQRKTLSRHSIKTIAQMAGKAGRRVAVELLPRTCLGRSASELLELLEGVDAGTAGVCLDTNHLMDRFRSLPDAVRALGPRLIALHCSDYDGVDEKHWPPLRGVIDWPAFFDALVAAGFSGPFHYEAGLDGETPAERLAFLEGNFAQLAEAHLSRSAAASPGGSRDECNRG